MKRLTTEKGIEYIIKNCNASNALTIIILERIVRKSLYTNVLSGVSILKPLVVLAVINYSNINVLCSPNSGFAGVVRRVP